MLRILMTILPCLLLACAMMGHDPSTTRSWDGEVQVHGALRAMLHEGQTGATVTLETMLPNSDLYAVGALANLSGEITVLGGKAYLAFPEGAGEVRIETTARSNVGATLLVSAEVPVWRAVTIESPIRFEELDDEIARLAAAAGMSIDARFPFLMEGDFEDLQWHVIDGRRLTDKGTSHEDHLGAAVKGNLDHVAASLVGFYSSHDQGVFTHMASRTHIHCVVDDPLSSGHVDHVVVPAGAVIKFPVGRVERPNHTRHSSAGIGAARTSHTARRG